MVWCFSCTNEWIILWRFREMLGNIYRIQEKSSSSFVLKRLRLFLAVLVFNHIFGWERWFRGKSQVRSGNTIGFEKEFLKGFIRRHIWRSIVEFDQSGGVVWHWKMWFRFPDFWTVVLYTFCIDDGFALFRFKMETYLSTFQQFADEEWLSYVNGVSQHTLYNMYIKNDWRHSRYIPLLLAMARGCIVELFGR